MTITHSDSAPVLYFSREELQAARLTPSRLSDTDTLQSSSILRLVRRALAQAQCPIPPALEIRSFPSQHGLLCFVSPLAEGALSPQLEPAPLS